MLSAGVLAASALASGPPSKLLTELGDDELLRRVPELSGVRFDRDETLVRSVLLPALKSINQTFDKFADIAAAERISEVRLDKGGAWVQTQNEQFRYVVVVPQDSLEVRETRLSEKDGKGAQAGGGGFATGARFVALMQVLLPEFESQLRLRTIGRLGDAVIFAFVVDPGGPPGEDAQRQAPPGSPLAQGLVWIDTRQERPVRLLRELTLTRVGGAVEREQTDMTFANVRFDALDATLLLPGRVVFDALYGDVRAHAVHRFSEFRLYGRGDANDPELAQKNSGVFTALAAERDAIEWLGEGVAALDAGNRTAAVQALREAVRLDAALAPAHYHMARALRAAGDAAGAEREARAALNGMQDAYAAHNLLGILLMERGAPADALIELRESVRLAPEDPMTHSNLARGLDAAGDHAGALAEMHRAVELAPDNKALRAQLERMSAPAPQQVESPDHPAIRVDVRQVLVPVIVLDKAGHNVGDLRPADFRLLEDGVEQAVTSFRVETSGQANVGPAPNPAAGKPAAPVLQAGAAAGARHTYLIVIDAFHSRFENLHTAREALHKFFAAEQPGDSQYAVISLGQTINIVQNMTGDPAVALAALSDKAFLKIAAGSRGAAAAADERQFEQHVARVRALWDANEKIAETELRVLPGEAGAIEAVERNATLAFLGSLRNLVRELAKGKERCTLILISDGFQLFPGRAAWQMFAAYFPERPPETKDAELRSLDRLQGEFESVVKVAAQANIVIDTIDSRGLYTDASLDASAPGPPPALAASVAAKHNALQMEAGVTLAEFAAATGGTSFQNSNDLLAGIRKAVAEGRNYYTLGYVSTNAAMDGKFRNITVEVKGRKVTVRAKRGYWATPD